MPKAIVVGAGLSGLSVSISLERKGFEILMIDRDSEVGGRVQTDLVHGYRCDRGFQVLPTSYPAAIRQLDFNALNLKFYDSAAHIYKDGKTLSIGHPILFPKEALSGFLGGVLTLKDAWILSKLIVRLRLLGPSKILKLSRNSEGKTNLKQYLQDLGLSEQIIGLFLKPFFGGVLLDKHLLSEAWKFLYYLYFFVTGPVAIPALGMGEISKQLRSRLKKTEFLMNTKVVGVDEKSVRIEGGTTFEADQVITALSQRQTNHLIGQEESESMDVSTFYYSVPRPLMKGRRLLLNGDPESVVTHVHFPTLVSSELASNGGTLMSVTVLGQDGNEASVRSEIDTELCKIFDLTKPCWEMIHFLHIDDALPRNQLAGRLPPRRSGPISIGDWLTTGSIQGALECGEKITEWLEPQ